MLVIVVVARLLFPFSFVVIMVCCCSCLLLFVVACRLPLFVVGRLSSFIVRCLLFDDRFWLWFVVSVLTFAGWHCLFLCVMC